MNSDIAITENGSRVEYRSAWNAGIYFAPLSNVAVDRKLDRRLKSLAAAAPVSAALHIVTTLAYRYRPTSASFRVLSRYGVARACSELVDGHEYAMKSVIKRLRFPLEIMLVCVRWYVAYPLSLRNLEEMMQERGVRVDHSTIHRWILRLMPVLERTFQKRKAAVSTSWRMDETYIKIGGQWKYLYRAVDKAGNTVDFLLTAKRDRAAAQRFLARAIGNHGLPQTVTIDKSGANTAGIESYNAEHDTAITIRQCKYLNNIVEQDHRAVKRIIRPLLGFKAFRCARVILAGVEIMCMICKGQPRSNDGSALSAAQQFYSLAT